MELNNNKVSHICLVGDDPTSNLTPLIDKDIPCDRLIIVHTIDQKEQYDNLYRVAKSRGAKVDSWLLPQTIDTESIKLSFMQLFERESKGAEKDLRHIWLNSSNGTRQQVLSAYEVARSFQCPIFIVEAEYDSLCWLYPEEWPLTPIKDKLKLHEFFEVNGAILISQKNKQGIEKKHGDLGKRWLHKSNKLHSGLAKLNYLASMAKGINFSSKQNQGMLKDESLQWLLDDLQQAELITISGAEVKFIDNDARFFCNGGWLEEVTFGMIQSLKSEIPSIQDEGHSVEIGRKMDGKTVRNELDVVAFVNNKLHIIECKTKRFDKGEGSDTLYKLDSLAEILGGIKAIAGLVTFFPITEAEKRRAKALNIEIFGPAKLPRLRECLKAWLGE